MSSEQSGSPNEVKLQFARHNFDNLQSLIRFADTKAAAYVTLLIFLGASAIPVAKDAVPKLRWIVRGGALTGSVYVLSCVSFLLGFLWVVLLVHSVIKPRGARHYAAPQRGHEMHFFGHIVTYSGNQEYFDAVAAATPELLLRNLTDQVFELATICDDKMGYLTRAGAPLLIAFSSWCANLALGLWLMRWH